MPTFSPDDVVDFLVTEGVVRAGQEAEHEAHKKASEEAERKRITSPDNVKKWAEDNALLPGGGNR